MVIKNLFLDADGVLYRKISQVVNCEINELTESENSKEVIWRYWEPAKIGKISSKEMWLGGSNIENYESGVFKELGISPSDYDLFIARY